VDDKIARSLIFEYTYIYIAEKTESTDTKSTTASSTSSHSSFADTSEGWQSDGRTLTLMHRVSAVEKHIEDVQAKLFLCKQDTRLLSYGRGNIYFFY
jgi:hypothetical protein